MNEVKKILELTNGGLDVFIYYLGDKCLKKSFRNPLREDARPSCHLYPNKDSYGNIQYYLQDFGDSSFCGNCFTIVGKLCGINTRLNFREVLEVIDRDLSLDIFDNASYSQQRLVVKKVISKERLKEEKDFISFEYKSKSYTHNEKDYWKKYGINMEILEQYNVYSLDSIKFTRKDGSSFANFSSKAIPMFAYLFGQAKVQGLKIYRPTAKNRFLYAGRLPKPYIFGWEQLPKNGEVVTITGGEKDVLSLAAHGFNAIAFNSETAKIPEAIMTELQGRFAKILFLYDMDETGKKESQNRVEEYKDKYNVGRVELPLTGTKKEKDISDFFAQGNSGKVLNKLLLSVL